MTYSEHGTATSPGLLRGGRLYYDIPIGVLCLESLFPKPRGHIRNPLTYSFPVVTRVVRGADIPGLLFGSAEDKQKLFPLFLEAAKQLEADGVQAVTGSCGFMALFQEEMSRQLTVPVFMSSLVQLPLCRLLHGRDARIGVLTASAAALTAQHFANCATDMADIPVRGMEGNREFWETIIEGRRHDFDMCRLEREIVETARDFASREKLDALLLECTDLSAFSAAVQAAVQLPVYDINTLVEYVQYAVCRRQY